MIISYHSIFCKEHDGVIKNQYETYFNLFSQDKKIIRQIKCIYILLLPI